MDLLESVQLLYFHIPVIQRYGNSYNYTYNRAHIKKKNIHNKYIKKCKKSICHSDA